jgi:formamidopyrimidine-DNA glycosylase
MVGRGMPELPEVECWGRRVIASGGVGKTIARCYAADDRIVYDGVVPRTFSRQVKGKTIVAAHRHGKQLWLEFDAGPHALFHLAMSGSFRHYEEPKDRPRFCKCEFAFDDGTFLAFKNARRFGRIKLRNDPRHEPPLSNLGPDPHADLPSAAWFVEQFARRKTPWKALLLNQSFLAGIGNWIADEVAYHTKLDPRRRAIELTEAEVKRVRVKIRHVLRKAIDWEADYTRFPPHWLFHHRWGKDQTARTHDGHEIEFSTVAGRTTAWVPAVQI